MKLTHLVAMLFISLQCWAQSGVTLYTGVSYAVSPDKKMTPNGTAHLGYTVGITARLFDDPMYFLINAEYGAFNLQATQQLTFVSNKNLSYTKGRFGLGFDIAKLGAKTTLRTKFQGNILVIYKVAQEELPSDATSSDKYIKLNEAIAGLSTGIGLTYKHLDFDFEYEYGLYNIYYAKKETTMNFYNFTVGIRF